MTGQKVAHKYFRIQQWLMIGLLTMALGMIPACGFHLREPAQLSFKVVELTGKSQINTALKKALQAQGVRLVEHGETAELKVEIIKEENEKRILSLSGAGVVREYELYYRIFYRTKLSSDAVWSLPLVMESRKDFTYTDASLLAKQAEEKRLSDTMHAEVMSGILRRLSAIKPTDK